jgi:hypothetical protein
MLRVLFKWLQFINIKTRSAPLVFCDTINLLLRLTVRINGLEIAVDTFKRYIDSVYIRAPRIIGFLRDIHRYAKASHRGGSVKELISNLVYSGK